MLLSSPITNGFTLARKFIELAAADRGLYLFFRKTIDYPHARYAKYSDSSTGHCNIAVMNESSTYKHGATKGRGALSNVSGRFESHRHEAFDDGWDFRDEESRPKTRVQIDAARSILSHNKSPDVPFDLSLNPYRGCEHGCVYCFARRRTLVAPSFAASP